MKKKQVIKIIIGVFSGIITDTLNGEVKSIVIKNSIPSWISNPSNYKRYEKEEWKVKWK